MKKLIEYTIGMIIISIGVAFMLYSDKGVSTFDAISHNLRNIYKIDIAVAIFIISTLMILIALIVNPKPQVLLSIVCTVLISVLISGFEKLFEAYLPSTVIIKYIYMVIGVLLTPIGAALMIESNYPPSSVDMFIKATNEKYKIKIGVLKYLTEVFFLIVTFCFGLYAKSINPEFSFGIGLGTIILALCSGAIMQITINILRRRNRNEN